MNEEPIKFAVLIYVVALTTLAFLIYIGIKSQKIREFKKNLKPGYWCYYYEGEERMAARVEVIKDELVLLKNEYDELIYRNINDLYI